MSNPKAEEISTISDIVTVWMKNTNAMWETMAKAYPTDDNETDANTGNGPPNRLQEKFAANFRLWQATAKTMEESETVEALFKGLQAIPDASTRLLNNSIENVTKFQGRWLKYIEKNRNTAGAYHLDDHDSDFFNQWTDLYEKEIQHFLNIPQLGLTKFYQEKLNQTVDKTNLFQTATVEFLRLLFVPIEKSITTLQEKLSDLVSEGKLPDDNRDYYRMWIQILEGHYMSLFKSSDYTCALSKTLETMNQFINSRSQVLEDILQTLPIPTNKDMDALYRDLYQLKRRVVSLEKQVKRINPQTTTV